MAKTFTISDRVLTEMYYFLYYEKFDGKIAPPEDLLFMEDGTWLKDAAVFDEIRIREGAWDVYLVFANNKKPLQLIVKNITRCFSEQKAISAAFLIRKEAEKDQRGTLSISINDLDVCNN